LGRSAGAAIDLMKSHNARSTIPLASRIAERIEAN
jgi:hypothetical protein